MQHEIEEFGNLETPYGKLIKTFNLDIAGKSITVPYINPFAFLYHMCACVAAFGDLLRNCIFGDGTIIMYSDEIKVGNVLRPDDGRAMECIYWTILQLPDWFRSRQHGWFSFLQIRSKYVAKLPGGMAFLWKKVLAIFFGEGWNFEKVGVRCPTSSGFFIFRARFGAFLEDEKAIKETWSVKGASGTKPCLWCKNVVGRMTCNRGGYLTHFSWGTPRDFDRHTDESFEEIVMILREAKQQNRKLSLMHYAKPLASPTTPSLCCSTTTCAKLLAQSLALFGIGCMF